MKKFKKLKIGTGSSNSFYSNFLQLKAKFKFTNQILLQKFIHKLSPYMQDQINSESKYLDIIKNLAIYCQNI